MEDKESGSLSQKPVLDLLVELHSQAVTGSLKLERAPLQKAVYFRDGQILFAASNDPKDQLASILVEEGKLGPDQMQVAQARVSPGNPLAKVLTELGYISQRELADAARIKVEKILTDLYGWKEGTYQFATKSLPKGAIDLELSTPRLMLNSIRRIQDRDWVLKQLDSLESVLSPGPSLESFIDSTKADEQAVEVLRLADGVKSIKQIGAVSPLGEFEVCKILAAALVVGALEKAGSAAVTASDDAFAFPTEEPQFQPATTEFNAPESPSFGNETLGLPTVEPEPPQQPTSDATVFEAPPQPPLEVPSAPPSGGSEEERTIFDAAPPPLPRDEPTFEPQPSPIPSASQLMIDEPEPDTEGEIGGRRPPRPKKMRGGGGGGGGSAGGLLKGLVAVVFIGAAAFGGYRFVWPLIVGGDGETSTSAGASTSVATTTTPQPAASTSVAPASGTTTDPRAPSSGTGSTATTSAAGGTRPTPPTTTSAPPPTTSVASTRPVPAPTTTTPSAAGRNGRALLRSGDLTAAARAFENELQGAGNRFTIAVGLYCNQANVARLLSGFNDSNQLYLLPATVSGQNCYRVVWGLFDSRESAQQGIRTVPAGIRAGDVSPVALSRILR
jgi:hypothetical protein